MKTRISVITLGVSDLERSRTFYKNLFDLSPSSLSNEHITFFSVGGLVVGLFGLEDLAKDACLKTIKQSTDFGGITLAYVVKNKEEVSQILDHAATLGALILKPAQDVFWGGHSGYFSDLDGHVWEVAFNPFFTLDAIGNIALPQ